MNKNFILIYSLFNILSIYQLENSGLKYELSEKDFIKFNKITNSNLLKLSTLPLTIFSNINISSEKKVDNNENIINNDKKIISPKNQALLIINEVQMAKYLYDNIIFNVNHPLHDIEKTLGLIFLKSAINQGKYCHENLKNDLEFFIDKKIEIEQDTNTVKLQPLIDNTNLSTVNWENQSYMLLAYYELYKILKNNYFEIYYSEKEANYFEEKFSNLLEKILSNENNIINLETNILSSIFPPILKSLKEFYENENNKYFILSISEELYSREFELGYIYSDKNKTKAASLATHFNTIESLITAYNCTQFDCFLYLAERIFKNLSWFWDDELNLYNLINDKDLIYTSKTISYILKSLNNLYNTTNSEGIKRKIKKQFDKILNSSIILLNNKDYLLSKKIESINIENLIENPYYFLIKSGFKINPDNNKLSIYEKKVITEYNLLLANTLFEIATNP
ncbi:hypothetical protein SAMN02745883_02190 [Caminicella sporogenes DSM 14501]|uniref:Uncharacterized protein n=1 Tax=Caminicella sporogenes DSM 14501 TaxID=1121266 RepID=A0A1M6SZX2_9FIRM|nr:hypothetical protein [Caminicella sporogenes]RKD26391.1 hypothetical protein BET04_10875 [Caminicella sporogenes]SHK50098.1 hypothetical protein SAMN02745883_02190 [Caminicella sporogenes DSM 14501]